MIKRMYGIAKAGVVLALVLWLSLAGLGHAWAQDTGFGQPAGGFSPAPMGGGMPGMAGGMDPLGMPGTVGGMDMAGMPDMTGGMDLPDMPGTMGEMDIPDVSAALPAPNFELMEPELGQDGGSNDGGMPYGLDLVPDLQIDPAFAEPNTYDPGSNSFDLPSLPASDFQLTEPELGSSSGYQPSGSGSAFDVQMYTPDYGSTEPPSMPGFPERGPGWPEDNPSGYGVQVDIPLGPVDISITAYGGGDSGMGATLTVPLNSPYR